MTRLAGSRLWRVIQRETPERLRLIIWMNLLSAGATVMMLWLVQAATTEARENGQPGGRLLLMFLLTVALLAISNRASQITASQDAERLKHRLRLRLFDLVRHTDMLTFEQVGRAALNGVLVHDIQTLGRILPVLGVAAQQAMMLILLLLYLAWLSPVASVMAVGCGGLAVAVRVARTREFRRQLQEAASAEADVFDGLTDMLQGFKEVRMSRPRAAALVEAIGGASGRACRVNIAAKSQWGRDHALIEVLFYTLIGLMVFGVPLFTTDFHSVVVPATVAALFITGPISSVSFVAPMLTQAEAALSNIEAMEQRLRDAARTAAGAEDAGGAQADAAPLPPPRRIAIAAGRFSYRDEQGQPVYTVGPMDLEFQAGEIAFITGGNGSGKSTVLRLLTGLIPLESGDLLADGQPVPAGRMQAWRDQFSAIFSDNHLSRRLYGVGPVTDADVAPLLTHLEIRDKVSVVDGGFSTTSLSTGQRKRLALVVARLEDKKVIVLDEWAADQDPHYRRVFYEELLPELRAQDKIVICVTHDDRWFHLADRTYRMDEGRLQPVDTAGRAGGPA